MGDDTAPKVVGFGLIHKSDRSLSAPAINVYAPTTKMTSLTLKTLGSQTKFTPVELFLTNPMLKPFPEARVSTRVPIVAIAAFVGPTSLLNPANAAIATIGTRV